MLAGLFKGLAIALLVLVVLPGASPDALRLHDGPVEFWPWFTISIGGPFRSGEVAPSPTSLEFLRDREKIEIQTLQPATSRTIWVPVVDLSPAAVQAVTSGSVWLFEVVDR